MLRALLAALLTGLAAPAVALCAGDSFLDTLAPDALAAIETSAAAEPYAEGTQWDLTRDGTTLTLVGTMHVHDARLAALRDRALPALQQADLLLVEATAEEEMAMQAAFAASPDLFLITDGPTLPDLLPPEDWAQVQAAANDRGIPGFMVAQMQPWYLSLTLGIPACAMADLVAGKRGLDHMLIAEAEAAGIPLQALESWETLIDVLASSTMEEQLQALQLSLLPRETQQSLYVAMLDTYFAERTAVVWALGEVAARELTDLSETEAAEMMAETRDILLDQRNLNWIPVIEAAAATHDTIMVAVGAAHLPGELGLLELLAAEGWTITRVP